MKRIIIYHCITSLALLLVCGLLQAQTAEEIKTTFPGEEAVVLNHTVAYQFKIINGQPAAESRELEQIMYLSDNAAAYMSKYNFYQSGFHELKEYQAYTKQPMAKKLK